MTCAQVLRTFHVLNSFSVPYIFASTALGAEEAAARPSARAQPPRLTLIPPRLRTARPRALSSPRDPPERGGSRSRGTRIYGPVLLTHPHGEHLRCPGLLPSISGWGAPQGTRGHISKCTFRPCIESRRSWIGRARAPGLPLSVARLLSLEANRLCLRLILLFGQRAPNALWVV